MLIGPHKLKNNLVLAPMAGITDQPFRILCRELGAGLVVSEMVTSNTSLFRSRKTKQRIDIGIPIKNAKICIFLKIERKKGLSFLKKSISHKTNEPQL